MDAGGSHRGTTAIRPVADLPGPRGLPLVGNAHQLGRPDRLHLKVEEWSRQYGPIFRFKIGSQLMVAVGDTAAVNEVLRDRPDGYERWSVQRDILEELGDPRRAHGEVQWGLFGIEGDEWKKQRRPILSALNAAQFPRYFDIVHTANEHLHGRLLEAAHDGRSLDMLDLFTSYTIDVLVALTLGYDPNSLERGDSDLQLHFKRLVKMIIRRFSAPVPYWRRFKLPADRALERSLVEIYRAMESSLERTKARLEAEPEHYEAPRNVLEALLATQKADPSFTDEKILSNLISLLIGGEDTTTATLGWTIFLLGSNPDAQERLVAETAEVLGEANIAADCETAEQLAYTEAVLRESMRMKSVIPLLPLEPTEDKEVCGTRIPAGTPLFLMLRQAAYTTAGRSDEFYPGRWLEDSDETRPSKSLTFGGGPRFCAGRNFALLESKAAVSTIAHNFELELDDSHGPVKESCVPAMSPHGLRVRVKTRRTAGVPEAMRA